MRARAGGSAGQNLGIAANQQAALGNGVIDGGVLEVTGGVEGIPLYNPGGSLLDIFHSNHPLFFAIPIYNSSTHPHQSQ